MRKKDVRSKSVAFATIVSTLLLLGSVSLAQESSVPHKFSYGEKDPNTAFWWSFGGTAVSLAVLAVGRNGAQSLTSWGALGLLVAPSLGYFYGGMPGRGIQGMGVRLLGAAIAVFAVLKAFDLSWGTDGSGGEAAGLTSIALVGLGIYAGSVIWDVAAVKGAIIKRNSRGIGRSAAVSPLLDPRTKTVALTLRLSF